MVSQKRTCIHAAERQVCTTSRPYTWKLRSTRFDPFETFPSIIANVSNGCEALPLMAAFLSDEPCRAKVEGVPGAAASTSTSD